MTTKTNGQRPAKATSNTPDDDRHRDRRVMRLLLLGHKPDAAAKQERVSRRHARGLAKELREAELDGSDEWLTPAQACIPMRLNPRRARWYCEQGRLGERLAGRVWMIHRDDLLDFSAREHRTGHPGRKTAEHERDAT